MRSTLLRHGGRRRHRLRDPDGRDVQGDTIHGGVVAVGDEVDEPLDLVARSDVDERAGHPYSITLIIYAA